LEEEDENNDDDLGVQNTESCVSSKKSVKKRSHARIIRSVWFNKESQPENIIMSSSCFSIPGEMNRPI
jgi:hypothetical protein